MIGRTNASTAPTTGDYLVRYIDINGTVLKEQYVNSGQDATPPANANYDSSYLTFSAWSKSSTNITNHKDIGALYTTINKKTYAFITLTTASGVAPTLYFNKSDGSTLTVDWGDGNQSTFTNTGNFNTGAHTYSATGNYIISIWISTGTGTYRLSNGSNTTMFLGTYKAVLTKIYIGSNVTSIGAYAFYQHYSLEVMSIPSTLTTLGDYCMQYCYRLKCGILNDNITLLAHSTYSNCFSLVNAVLPTSVTSFNINAFQSCRLLKYVVLSSTSSTTLGTGTFQYCYSLENIVLNSSIQYTGSALTDAMSIKSLVFPSGFLQHQASNTGLSALISVDFPSSTTNINVFTNCYSLTKVICRATTVPTLQSGAFSTQVTNRLFKIYVPDAQVTTYQAAANWSAYTNYIYSILTL